METIKYALWFPGTLMATVAFLVLRVHRSIIATAGKSPVSEKMLRPPGHSVRIKLVALEDRLWCTYGFLAVSSLVAAFLFSITRPVLAVSTAAAALCVLLGVYLLSVPVRLMQRTFKMIAHYRLGLLGEEVVGAQLNRLMLRGCEVFHDVPTGEIGNIDHVVVSPRGVFAVETKTRRKPEMKDGHKVIFTGKTLRYPTWTDAHGLQQVADNARWLGRFLTEATGEAVSASPILTLPGWMVERRGQNGVSVLNPKEIKELVLDDSRPALSVGQRQRICHQLDRKCRDVAV